ncbi:MAG: phosphonate metabolism transcriptional regulator PhnF [Roseovarius sp.]|nr:phosphonate metabolism transcriptional regulator PhnF [Roseovarius sp.]MCY4314627.1 phosphonate metabolism transcriptional regulator PhnF [Roseovarius sp.]
MSSATLWKTISDTILEDIASGHFSEGSKLPTEAELVRRFGVNRHTVRKSLAALADKGILRSRRGSGVYVAHPPTVYNMSDRVRFSQNLAEAGRTPSRKVLNLLTRKASREEAAALQLTPGAAVHHYEGISFGDSEPIALFQSVFCANRFPQLAKALEIQNSVTRALKNCGLKDYTRASTQIAAVAATPVQANHLLLKPGDPLIATKSVNVDEHDIPVEYGRSHFSGARVTLNYS